MKYEMIFGDEKLFDGAPEECFCVARNAYGDRIFYKTECGALFWLYNDEWKPLQVMSCTPLAMRRIIKTPVWTVADQQAGRLPEVGCKCIWVDKSGEPGPEGMKYPKNGCEVEIIAHYENYNNSVAVFKFKTEEGMYVAVSVYVDDFKPIESPEEKAARLREEWCESALKIINHKFIDARGPMAIYDALLTGDLPVPKGSE